MELKFEAAIAVAHKVFSKSRNLFWKSLITKEGIIYDLKNIVPEEISSLRL